MTKTVPTAISEYVAASNAFDGDRLIAAFAADAMVNDARREFWGIEAIRRWSDKEIIGDKVTMDVQEVVEHHGMFVVTAIVDGDFDRSNLPDVVLLTHYFMIREDKITNLIIILNTPTT
jgi:hypothetical protein